ncbi:hypothetical protein [Telmatospirillum sp.]|uniref:hypothetical protein n=1 Tax=Telmatospirillum sp. TaxID=2079197 RepID=UPI00284B17DE|nr:hypothetical protein [Telmatospirillum sp.]MDR3435883.1 hypothetical protein [Telmatospirillum sp.]
MNLRFWKKKEAYPSPQDEPVDVKWYRDERGYFQRLLRLRPKEAGLTGLGGVYVMWHRGVHPKWIYVGVTDDLEAAIENARDSRKVLAFESFGSVYVTWSPILQAYRDGVVVYLRNTLSPEIDEDFATDRLNHKASPIPVLPPG